MGSLYEYDGLVIGDLITEQWLNKGSITSLAIGKMYNLNKRDDLTGLNKLAFTMNGHIVE